MTQLSRRITPATLFMLITNSIIGSGWLLVPLYAAKIAGAASMISWFIGGVSAILVAFTFAELATMIPVAGGTAHIPQLSHGALSSFLFGWIAWLTSLMLTPIEVQAVLQYGSLFFPSLMHVVHGAAVLSLYGYAWATILMLLLCFVNVVSYQGLMRFNLILFVFKFVVIFFTIILIYKAQFRTENFHGMFASTHSMAGWQAIFSAVATGGVVFAFNGFKNGIEMAGETKNLAVAIPLSTVGSVVACLIIYLALQAVFIGALSPESFAHGWQSLSFAGDLGPYVGIAAALGLFMLLKFIYLNAVVSPLGAGLVYVTTSARILYALSQIGYMPSVFAKLNRHHLPLNAIILNFVIGMLSFLPLPGWQAMVQFLVSTMVITYAMGPIGLYSLRLSMPNRHRPFRLPFAKLWCFIAFYCCNLFCYWTGWDTMLRLGIVLFVGLVIFMLAKWRKKINISGKQLQAAYWMLPYLFGLVLITFLGAFGGRDIIPFGWDFLVIGIFSYWILEYAAKSRIDHTEEALEAYISTHSADGCLIKPE